MKITLKYIGTIVILIVLYVASLTTTSMIPKKLIEENIKKSVSSIYYLDSFTDSAMLDISYRIDEKKPFESAIRANMISKKTGIDYILDDYNATIGLKNDFSEEKDEEYNYSYDYARFWHGYLIYLRPLLILFDYSQIQFIETIVLITLFVVLAKDLFIKIDPVIAFVIILSLITIDYFLLGLVLSIFPTISLAMIFSIIILKSSNKDYDICWIFLLNGSITCFFNYMTFTPITLGLPLIIYYLSTDDYSIKKFIKITLSYVLSYAITWACKWVIADVFFDMDIIKNSLKQIYLRIADDMNGQVRATPLYSIKINIFLFLIPFFIEFYMFIIMYIRSRCKLKVFIKNLVCKKNLLFLLIGLIPFAIYITTPNHSVIHANKYSKRLLVLTLIAAFIIMDNTLKRCIKPHK